MSHGIVATRALALALVAITLTLARSVAHAADAVEPWAGQLPTEVVDDEPTHGGHAKAHTQNLLGAKALATVAITTGHEGEGLRATPHYGASMFYERELVADWLELELVVATLSAHDGVHVPFDLLFKKPFHVSRHVTPYLALGPAIEARFEDESTIAGGLTASTGMYVWFTSRFGVDIEVDYSLLSAEEGIEHAPAFGIGPAAHF